MAWIDQSLIRLLRTEDSLQWFVEFDIGFYPVPDITLVYDEAYFAKYVGYAKTARGRLLNRQRVSLVRRHWPGAVVDVGIGCGSFIEAIGDDSKGFDINPAAVRWLIKHNCFRDPYLHGVDAATFWDSIEHIADFPSLLARVRQFVFISVPIFEGSAHVLRSKHYRRDEHYWYFTEAGLTRLMARLGWALVESNDAETRAGREGIGSFAFHREDAPCW